ncbi:hypothetical protein, partial [Sphaerisporangium aureirubrum]|uniref:hypothetical protein n=1 Tax=Sphaerisporangium aureirubrum TaxID=1544736 RepID=UPI003641EC53
RWSRFARKPRGLFSCGGHPRTPGLVGLIVPHRPPFRQFHLASEFHHLGQSQTFRHAEAGVQVVM